MEQTPASVQEIERQNNLGMTVYNPMNRAFVHSWGGAPYTIPPKSFLRVPAYIARHLAEHLSKFMLNHVEHRLMDKMLPDGRRVGSSLSKKEILEYAENLLNREGDADVLNGVVGSEMEAPEAGEVIEVAKLAPRDESLEEAIRKAAVETPDTGTEMEAPEEDEELMDTQPNPDPLSNVSEVEDDTAIPTITAPEGGRRRGRPAKV